MAPNSAPARYPQPPPQPPYQFINNQTGQPLVPVWNGSCWIYQQSVASPTTTVQVDSSSKLHRRKRSLPPPVPSPMPQGYPVMGSGGYFQPQPQQHQSFSAMARSPYSASLPATSAMYPYSGHTSPASGAYSLPQQNGYIQMPVPQVQMVQQSSSCLKPSNASMMSYPYGSATVIVDSKREHHKSSGSSFFGRSKKK